MAVRAAVLRHLRVPVRTLGVTPPKPDSWSLFNPIRFMSSHDDHLSKDEVIERVLPVVKCFPKVDPSAFAYNNHLGGNRRLFSSAAGNHRNNHPQMHKYLDPNSYIGSWEAPKTPREAETKLQKLRREYAKQVKELRKEYITEMEAMRLEKQRKEEARKEALRVANEEKRKLKAEAAKVRAEERKIAHEEFQKTLLKERTEKLENWRMKEQKREEKKKEQRELLRRQSSLWVDESKLEREILVATHHTTAL